MKCYLFRLAGIAECPENKLLCKEKTDREKDRGKNRQRKKMDNFLCVIERDRENK